MSDWWVNHHSSRQRLNKSPVLSQIPWNSADMLKFCGKGLIPRLGSKFCNPQKTVGPSHKTKSWWWNYQDNDAITYSEKIRPRRDQAFPVRSLGTWRRKQGSKGRDWTTSWDWGNYWHQCSSYRTDSVSRICCSQLRCWSTQATVMDTVHTELPSNSSILVSYRNV